MAWSDGNKTKTMTKTGLGHAIGLVKLVLFPPLQAIQTLAYEKNQA